jgi:hypothetical protein
MRIVYHDRGRMLPVHAHSDSGVHAQFFIAASFYLLCHRARRPRSAWRWYGGYACVALAVLTKGLLAIVVVGLALLLYVAISGEWRRWREFHLFTGTLLFLAIAAPWHMLAGIRNPHFFWFYFVNEHFMRFLGKRIPKDYNKQTDSLYWTLHLVWLFPWSLYLPVALRRPISRVDGAPQAGREHRTAAAPLNFRSRTELLCLVWAGVTLVFFSFSTNQEYYTFPAYLPILLLIAARLAERRRIGLAALAGVEGGALLALICIAARPCWRRDCGARASAVRARHRHRARQARPQAETLSMGHMLDLTGESFAALRLPAMLAAIVLLIGPAWPSGCGGAARTPLPRGRRRRHHGDVSDRRAHRSGALRSFPGIAKHGRTDRSGTEADRPRDDLRRSVVWLVAAVLPAAAD